MLIGHQKIWQYLTKTAEENKFPHALLFSGPEKVGKKTFALEFVKWLFKNDIENKPHPDFIFIKPEGKEIKISQIRECIWKLSLKPSVASYKIAIIDQAHCMNSESQNCFLKTLEEPKGKTILILITEYPEALFPTILSRIQKIKFFPVKKEEIENFLKKGRLDKVEKNKNSSFSINQEEEKEILEISAGRPGLAIDLMLNPDKLKERKEKIKELIKITDSDLVSRFQYVKKISEDPDKLKEILDIWLSYFRKNLFEKCLNSEFNQLEKLKKIIKTIQNTNFLILQTNANSRLALEVLMLEL